MRPYQAMLCAGVILISSSGCGVLQRVEQWKCDHWGMCHGNLQPTQPCAPPPMLHNPVAPPPDFYAPQPL